MQSNYGFGTRVIATLAIFLQATSTFAWGPHTEITRAALSVLPNEKTLSRRYGKDWDRIAKDYVWTPDWNQSVRPDHYADDYLLFPGMATHIGHLPPVVRQTYVPFFRRALQAIRTESPENAARWIGSLLHFVQDSGSPSHAFPTGGPLHGKMERWVDASKISITGYKPRLLGKSDVLAERAFAARMESLIRYSNRRGRKLLPLVKKITKRVDQPLELDCAIECARVSADVLHTLFTLGEQNPRDDSAGLRGSLKYQPPVGYASVPAKVMIAGTSYSTTTNKQGRFLFRNLPAGTYTVHVLATGYRSASVQRVTLKKGEVTELRCSLSRDSVPRNLIRNPSFKISWIAKGQPDFWKWESKKHRRWTAALIRVPIGSRCRVSVLPKGHRAVPIIVRWRSNPSNTAGSRLSSIELKRETASKRWSATISTDPTLKPFEKGFHFLELMIETTLPLPNALEHVAVTLIDR